MKKRVVAAVAAVLLATMGVFALISYARGANDRAYEGATMVPVLQVQSDIPAKTPTERLADSVKLVEVPRSVRVDDALVSLDEVRSMSTNTALKKGEQLLRSRFGSESEAKADSEVPDGFQEVSIMLAPPRLAGGKLKAGDRVGVIVSYPKDQDTPARTSFIKRQQVLVTRVVNSAVPAADGTTGSALVTLAVKTIDAEKIVHASEFGKVWLTLQNEKTDTGGDTVVEQKDALQ